MVDASKKQSYFTKVKKGFFNCFDRGLQSAHQEELKSGEKSRNGPTCEEKRGFKDAASSC